MSVGSNIKKRRFELKMSQQELADAMGYKTRSTIAKIESGENDVSQQKLRKFAAVLDTTVEELILGAAASTLSAPTGNVGHFKTAKNVAIILAGGKSGRNRQNIPSQFININGKPILVYCMQVYEEHPAIDDVYVVCLKGWESIVEAYAKQYGITKLRSIIPAGNSGIFSLKNGLDHIKESYQSDDIIIVQEATRPMVRAEMISKLLQSAAEKNSATVCHSMNDYLQFDVSGGKAKYINRDSVIALQSPEAHRISIMNEVFKKAQKQNHPLVESCFTMLMYSLGYDINFIEGSVNNIKITREEDIAAFAALVKE